MARKVYKVAIDPDTLKLDRAATEGLRMLTTATTP
jgi:hypothetical protein